jgi:hypothetical protein
VFSGHVSEHGCGWMGPRQEFGAATASATLAMAEVSRSTVTPCLSHSTRSVREGAEDMIPHRGRSAASTAIPPGYRVAKNPMPRGRCTFRQRDVTKAEGRCRSRLCRLPV